MRAHVRRVVEYLRDIGAGDVRVERGGKHPKIFFDWQGRRRFYSISGTPRNADGASDEAIRDIRRLLTINDGGGRRSRKVRAARPHSVESFQLTMVEIQFEPSWQENLARHPAAVRTLPQRLDAAWLRWWRDLMARNGGASRL